MQAVSTSVIPYETPSSRCKLRQFVSLVEGKATAMRLYDEFGVIMEAYPCRVNGCGSFHLKFVRNIFKMRGVPSSENVQILTRLASGLRGPEIAKDMGMNSNVFWKRIQEMCARSGAISREQLLAVAIWTGIINIV